MSNPAHTTGVVSRSALRAAPQPGSVAAPRAPLAAVPDRYVDQAKALLKRLFRGSN